MLVVLLKGTVDEEPDDKKDKERYMRALPEFQCTLVPVLKFEAVQSEVNRLENAVFDSVLITSPRGLWALLKCASEGLKQRVADVPWFVVGEASRDAVIHNLGVQDVQGSDTGSAEKFVEKIKANSIQPRNVAYLCSNLRRSTMSDGLRQNGVLFEEFEVYRTVPYEEAAIPPVAPTIRRVCVFFSPSGVKAVSSQIKSDDIVVAIGQTTATALQEFKIKLTAIAESPSPEGLHRALLQAVELG